MYLTLDYGKLLVQNIYDPKSLYNCNLHLKIRMIAIGLQIADSVWKRVYEHNGYIALLLRYSPIAFAISTI